MIEKNELYFSKFQTLLSLYFNLYSTRLDNAVELATLIKRSGKTLKNHEWQNSQVIDLSSMPNGSIFINSFSNGSDFTTNIKTVEPFDLVYGSIRPYFKKSGFALDVDYIAGSVYSFSPICKGDYLWLLACISSERFHSFTSSSSQGTKMPIINWDTFASYMVPYDNSLIEQFNAKLMPLFLIAVNKMRKNRILDALKAKLLEKYF